MGSFQTIWRELTPNTSIAELQYGYWIYVTYDRKGRYEWFLKSPRHCVMARGSELGEGLAKQEACRIWVRFKLFNL